MNTKIAKSKTLIDDKIEDKKGDDPINYKNVQLTVALNSQNYAKLSKQKEKFVDDLFPPNETSIIPPGKTFEETHVEKREIPSFIKKQLPIKVEKKFENHSKYFWKRLTELYKPNEMNIIKFHPEIDEYPDIMTEDVKQGDLGDCYFLAVLSAFAEEPKRIEQMFPTKTISPNGIFEVKIYIHGSPTIVVIDDYIPCKETEKGTQIAFTSINPNTNNLWPLLLEKVWAKINLSYFNINSGVPSEALEILSPAPFDSFRHEEHYGKIMKEIQLADEKNYIICCSLNQNDSSANLDYLEKMGLVANHAYSVISTYEIYETNGKKINLLKLRNPWGNGEWSGDWSDNSTKWTEELKTILKYKNSDDGTFYINYTDYIRFFTTTYISKVRDNYFYVTNKFNFKFHNYNLTSVKVTEQGHGFFMCNQKTKRVFQNTKDRNDYDEMFCSMIVYKKDENITFVGAMSDQLNRIYVEANLSPGLYVILIFFPSQLDNYEALDVTSRKLSEGKQPSEMSYRVSVYSDIDKLSITEIPEEDNEKFTDDLITVLMHRAKNNHKIHHFIEEGEKDAWRSISFESDNGYISYYNPTEATLHERITITSLYGLNLVPIFDDDELTKIDIELEKSDPDSDKENNKYDIFEDDYENIAAENLLKCFKNQSEMTIIRNKEKGKEISKENPVIIEIKIGPNKHGVLLLQKYANNSGIEIESDIIFNYPTHVVLTEKKFKINKKKLKYNSERIDVFETIVNHNTGYMFKYRNKTDDKNFTVHVIFSELENLVLKQITEENQEKELDENYNLLHKKKTQFIVNPEFESDIKKYLPDIEIKDKEKEIILCMNPGETRFFILNSIDIFKPFSYKSNNNYYFNLAIDLQDN